MTTSHSYSSSNQMFSWKRLACSSCSDWYTFPTSKHEASTEIAEEKGEMTLRCTNTGWDQWPQLMGRFQLPASHSRKHLVQTYKTDLVCPRKTYPWLSHLLLIFRKVVFIWKLIWTKTINNKSLFSCTCVSLSFGEEVE